MAQLFIGVKPGVGPVVKVMRYNADDPLLIANDQFNRFFYNSETDKISYIYDPRTWYFTYGGQPPSGATSVDGGKYYTIRSTFTSTIDNVGVFAIKDNLFGVSSYPPILESRYKLSDGRVVGAERSWGKYDDWYPIITSNSFTSWWGKTKNFGNTPIWQTRFPPALSFLGLNKWVGMYSYGAGARDQGSLNGFPFVGTFQSTTYPNVNLITAFWDLPADASPMRVYTTAPNLETLRMNQSEIIMSRPGYSVNGSTGIGQRIFDSTQSPTLCVMSGDSPTINSGAFVDIPVPNGYELSENTIVEMIVKNTGADMYIPARMSYGSTGSANSRQLYRVFPKYIRLWNESTQAIIVRYIVFDADTRPNTTGGNQMMSTNNDGTDDYVRIKKPFTSDTTTQPNDIILDTRLPMVQIVKEGFIPLASFTTGAAEDQHALGRRAFQVNFTNDGFLPFVKYTLVFNDYILPPINAQKFGTSTAGPSSNQSCLCRLGNDYAKFWVNDGNWSRIASAYPHDDINDMPNPIGIRYYVFAIARP